ncbi:MAG: response regulator [Deltaproteobacteria bacterium]|nr:response regulator [Deltaproteobacteria bacterium]
MSKRTDKRPIHVLLVEDNPADAELATEVLHEGPLPKIVHTVEDGLEALSFLRREARFAEAPRPGLIVLDLNMPRLDGRKFLSIVKSDPDLRGIPVVVLTSSEAPKDIDVCYDLQASSCIPKPLDLPSLLGVMTAFESYWFGAAVLPTSGG